jgi:hypothetical protein
MNNVFFYLAGGLTAAWGVSHLIPTKNVVKGFGNISADNKRIITMEWITEGVTLLFIGELLVICTAINAAAADACGLYWICAAVLVIMAVVSLFTGARVKLWPFKMCPVIFTLSAILIILGISV